MKVNITGRHIEITPPLRQYTIEKLDRLSRHFDRIINIDIILEVQKLDQIVKANLFVPGGQFNADAKSDDMYSAIDLLIDKLDRQIRDHKERERDH